MVQVHVCQYTCTSTFKRFFGHVHPYPFSWVYMYWLGATTVGVDLLGLRGVSRMRDPPQGLGSRSNSSKHEEHLTCITTKECNWCKILFLVYYIISVWDTGTMDGALMPACSTRPSLHAGWSTPGESLSMREVVAPRGKVVSVGWSNDCCYVIGDGSD